MTIEFIRCKGCGKTQRADRKICLSCGADILTGVRRTADSKGISNSFTSGLFRHHGYIDQNLMPGEKLIYRTKLHPVVFLGPAGVLLFVFGGAIKACQVGGSGAFGIGGQEIAIIFLIFLLLAVRYLPSPSFLSYFTSEFGITSERVLVKVGFFRRRSLEILLTKVESVMVDQGFLGRLLDYGTVVVTGTGGMKEPLERISAPLEFRKQLQERIALTQRPKEGARP